MPDTQLSLSPLARRLAALATFALAGAAHAAGNVIGQSLIEWASPIVLFLGCAAVVVALAGALFQPALIRGAAYTALILVIIFFLLHNLSAFQSAVQ